MMDIMEQLTQWYETEEHQKIVEAILKLPESERTDELLGKLAVAYNNLEKYDQAIAVLEQLRSRQENTYQWQYRLGYALYYGTEDLEKHHAVEQYKQAKEAFTRCLLLNPRPDIEADCREFLEEINEELAYFADQDRSDQEEHENAELEVYTDAEMDCVENHIAQYFGAFSNVFHEIISPDIHVDICIIPPSEERSFYTLVTMGMGAHRMAVPKELAEHKLERAELAICLPASWKIGAEEEIWYWPFRLLKRLARLPVYADTWLGWGHTVDNQEPYAENTALSGSLLIVAQAVEEAGHVCVLPDGDEVNFYQVIPLYEEEMAFKQANDAETLLDAMMDFSFVVDPERPAIDLDDTFGQDMSDYTLDWAALHLESIQEKNLPVDEITAYNHLAIYLRWCIERDLMSEQFLAEFPAVVQDVKQQKNAVDLRLLLRDELDSWLIYPYFNDVGIAFAQYYYSGDDDEMPYFPADIDDYALQYFGAERYYSEEFQDEAYLFVPYDENYYQGMKHYLENHYAKWCLEQKRH